MIQMCVSGTTRVKLAESIERGIRNDQLAPGEKLPSIRALAESLGLSPATVAGAYRQLQKRGFLVSQGRRGTVVSSRPPLPVASPMQAADGVTDCATGNPDPKLLPKLAPALAAIRKEQTLYDEDPNSPELVQLGLSLFQADGVPTTGICTVNGSFDGIERALAEHLFPGDRIAVEDPCFTGVLDLIRSRGLVPVPVALDQSGILPESLTEALKLKPKALIVTPRGQNPTGAAFTLSRARALKKVLAKAPDLFVIEDDYEGTISGAEYVGLCDGKRARWTVVRSLCKSFSPDLRIALQAGDPDTLAHIQGRQVLGIRWVSHLLQDMAVYYLKDKKTAQLIETAECTYTDRRTAFIEALKQEGVQSFGKSGFNVWVPVPDEASVAQRLMQAGWLVTPGYRYRLQTPPAIRVTVSSLPAAEAKKLAREIGRCLRGGAFVSSAV